MSGVVPPGGDGLIDDEPWPVRASPTKPTTIQLPDAPLPTPGVVPPTDWRSMREAAGFLPPGYRRAGDPSLHAVPKRDNFGLAGCVAGTAGLLQLLLVSVPLIAVLAVALSLSGRRFARLDPEGVDATLLSTIGLALGAAGVVAGAWLWIAGVSSVAF